MAEDQEKKPATATAKSFFAESAATLKLEKEDVSKLEEKLTLAEQKADENWNKYLRTQAELLNLQKRAEIDVANAHKYSLEKFARELLTVVDNLERSLTVKIVEDEQLKNFYVGVELTLKVFLGVLEKFEVKQLNPIGLKFDPAFHSAIQVVEKEATETNTILEVVQKGYLLKDRLLRPAVVIVAK
ncbi:MAG: nucleotide exchange factor GrpE [Gammaproteobacteria bacterium]|nr:nucleotide exchange factor GrpE [Gammaproteobacteria bacterium]